MEKAWFHKRKSSEGTGYSIASLKGLLATIVFLVLITGLVAGGTVLAIKFHIEPLIAVAAGAIIILILLAIFLWVIWKKSDQSDGKF